MEELVTGSIILILTRQTGTQLPLAEVSELGSGLANLELRTVSSSPVPSNVPPR